MSDADTILKLTRDVTKKWTKQKRAEIRNQKAVYRRWEMYRSRDMFFTEACEHVIPSAYQKVSANGTLPANARQVAYAARPELQRLTGKAMPKLSYFTQTLLPDYLANHPEQAAEWDIVYDARGHFVEPHTGHRVPLGHLAVREYLGTMGPLSFPREYAAPRPTVDTCGPAGRYQAVLFIEKEGFEPLIEASKIRERYDLAVMSTKGMSVTAARELIERLPGGVQIYVLHDFDHVGFRILGTLGQSTRRYQFQRHMHLIDLGVRLADVEAWGLESETYHPHGSAESVRENLQKNGATAEEAEFLLTERVEINAFTSAQLVRFLEQKLEAHGVTKVVPDTDTLTRAFQYGYEIERFGRLTTEIAEQAKTAAGNATVPEDLAARVRAALGEDPTRSWDSVVFEIAQGIEAEKDGGQP